MAPYVKSVCVCKWILGAFLSDRPLHLDVDGSDEVPQKTGEHSGDVDGHCEALIRSFHHVVVSSVEEVRDIRFVRREL